MSRLVFCFALVRHLALERFVYRKSVLVVGRRLLLMLRMEWWRAERAKRKEGGGGGDGVCVLHMKPLSLPFDIQHNLIVHALTLHPNRDASSAVIKLPVGGGCRIF